MFLSYQFGFTPFQFVEVQTSDLWLFILTLPRWSHHVWGKLSQQGFMFNNQHNIVIATCQCSIASESVQVRAVRFKEMAGSFECAFAEKVSKGVQFECPICLLVLREPYQATCSAVGRASVRSVFIA